jgi:hypothetical protein
MNLKFFVYDLDLKLVVGFYLLKTFHFAILNVWDLNLNWLFKFKSKTHPLIPLVGHQPTTHATRAHLLFPFSSSLPAREPAQQHQPAHHREASRPRPAYSPGQLTGGPHPSAFPFLPTDPRPRLSLPPARAPPPRRPLHDRGLQPPLPFSPFFPAAAPHPHVTWQPRAPVAAPRQRSATARPRAPLFPPCASAARAAKP